MGEAVTIPNPFAWNEEFDVGHHERNVENAFAMHLIAEVEANPGSCTKINRLVEFLKACFQREEDFLESVEFSKTSLHKRIHETFIEDLLAVVNRPRANQLRRRPTDHVGVAAHHALRRRSSDIGGLKIRRRGSEVCGGALRIRTSDIGSGGPLRRRASDVTRSGALRKSSCSSKHHLRQPSSASIRSPIRRRASDFGAIITRTPASESIMALAAAPRFFQNVPDMNLDRSDAAPPSSEKRLTESDMLFIKNWFVRHIMYEDMKMRREIFQDVPSDANLGLEEFDWKSIDDGSNSVNFNLVPSPLPKRRVPVASSVLTTANSATHLRSLSSSTGCLMGRGTVRKSMSAGTFTFFPPSGSLSSGPNALRTSESSSVLLASGSLISALPLKKETAVTTPAVRPPIHLALHNKTEDKLSAKTTQSRLVGSTRDSLDPLPPHRAEQHAATATTTTPRIQRTNCKSSDNSPLISLATYQDLFAGAYVFQISSDNISQSLDEVLLQISVLRFTHVMADLSSPAVPMVVATPEFCALLGCEPWELFGQSILSLGSASTSKDQTQLFHDVLAELRTAEAPPVASVGTSGLLGFQPVSQNSPAVVLLQIANRRTGRKHDCAVHVRKLLVEAHCYVVASVADVGHVRDLDVTHEAHVQRFANVANARMRGGEVHRKLFLPQKASAS